MDRTILFMYCVSILGTECLLCFFPFMLFSAFLGTECLLCFFPFMLFSAFLGTECLLCFFPFMLFFCIFSHNQLFLYLYVLLHDFLVLIPHFLFCLLSIAQSAAQVCVFSLLNVVCLVCAMYVGIYFCVGFWSYNSQCTERHLPHVH